MLIYCLLNVSKFFLLNAKDRLKKIMILEFIINYKSKKCLRKQYFIFLQAEKMVVSLF